MASMRVHMKTFLNIAFFAVLTVLLGLLTSRITALSLPIPRSLIYACTALPLVSGLSTLSVQSFAHQQQAHRKSARLACCLPRTVSVMTTGVFLIASTVLLTLLGNHIRPYETVPGIRDCGLQMQWQYLFKNKNMAAIRAIQDAFACCGFRNSRDMAWPFPDRDHKADACELALVRTNGCLEGWRGEESRLAGLMMGCVILVQIWIVLNGLPTSQTSWIENLLGRRRRANEHGEVGRIPSELNEEGRFVDYTDEAGSHSDRLLEGANNEGHQGESTTEQQRAATREV